MASSFLAVLAAVLTLLASISDHASAEIRGKTYRKLNDINRYGPYLGVVIPNQFEMDPLLNHPSYKPSPNRSVLDFAGRRFRIGTLAGQKVILVMTGLSTINAAIATQLLIDLFIIKGVVHYGIAGNASPDRHIGDVVIPHIWAHTGLWSWQRYGNGPENELPLEGQGDYTREYGFLRFAEYSTNVSGCNGEVDNLLNNVWYQPDEVFPVDGTIEERQHVFWMKVDPNYLGIAKQMKDLELDKCVDPETCLATTPKVYTPRAGVSSSIYLDNAAYREFLNKQYDVTPVDMETAAVSLICYQQRKPFIAIRALSDLAGGGSAESNEADTFLPLAAKNSITAVVEFVRLLNATATTAAPSGGAAGSRAHYDFE